MKPVIYPYKIGSHSARDLARALGTIQVRENGRYRQRINHKIINWGNPRMPKWYNIKLAKGFWLNHYVEHAQNKLTTFKIFKEKGIQTPEWTTDRKEAEKWLQNEYLVFCRKFLRSHSGNGITAVHQGQKLVDAPLYVQYKRKKKEFRVHVFNKEIIDVQQKRKASGAEDEEGYNAYIRSHDNGWIFARENIVEPKELRSIALAAISALGLDFGAVDIIWNEKENKCYCLEVNTAPGLEGQTLVSYVKAIQKCIN